MDPIPEFDAGDEDVVSRQKPKYARQLAMVDGKIRGRILMQKRKKIGQILTT